VLNVSMQLLQRKTISPGTSVYNIPVSDIPSGVYIVRIISAGKTEVRRFIKE